MVAAQAASNRSLSRFAQMQGIFTLAQTYSRSAWMSCQIRSGVAGIGTSMTL
jgi:hypothetical protein